MAGGITRVAARKGCSSFCAFTSLNIRGLAEKSLMLLMLRVRHDQSV